MRIGLTVLADGRIDMITFSPKTGALRVAFFHSWGEVLDFIPPGARVSVSAEQ